MQALQPSCETDHFEDYSLKLQCNSFLFGIISYFVYGVAWARISRRSPSYLMSMRQRLPNSDWEQRRSCRWAAQPRPLKTYRGEVYKC